MHLYVIVEVQGVIAEVALLGMGGGRGGLE